MYLTGLIFVILLNMKSSILTKGFAVVGVLATTWTVFIGVLVYVERALKRRADMREAQDRHPSAAPHATTAWMSTAATNGKPVQVPVGDGSSAKQDRLAARRGNIRG